MKRRYLSFMAGSVLAIGMLAGGRNGNTAANGSNTAVFSVDSMQQNGSGSVLEPVNGMCDGVYGLLADKNAGDKRGNRS